MHLYWVRIRRPDIRGPYGDSVKYEYKEGREARNNFEAAMETIFKAPKLPKVKRPAKAANDRKTDVSDKD